MQVRRAPPRRTPTGAPSGDRRVIRAQGAIPSAPTSRTSAQQSERGPKRTKPNLVSWTKLLTHLVAWGSIQGSARWRMAPQRGEAARSDLLLKFFWLPLSRGKLQVILAIMHSQSVQRSHRVRKGGVVARPYSPLMRSPLDASSPCGRLRLCLDVGLALEASAEGKVSCNISLATPGAAWHAGVSASRGVCISSPSNRQPSRSLNAKAHASLATLKFRSWFVVVRRWSLCRIRAAISIRHCAAGRRGSGRMARSAGQLDKVRGHCSGSLGEVATT